jgi:Notch-like protein
VSLCFDSSSTVLQACCCCSYTGSNCQNRINLCDSSPCLNGATCQDHTTHYTCHCPYGYTGKDCGEYVDWCATNPCENQATCRQIKNRYQCLCGVGWTGKVCDVEMVSCKDAALRKSVPLRSLCNNGTCEDIGNSHRCHCSDGYTGSYCQQEINECDSAPCQNGATCKDLVGSYSCQCAEGFQGQDCELNVDECKPNPCQNGGTCHDLVNKYLCSCPSGTLGLLCEINIDDCRPGACHNNGTCIDRVGGFECKCPPGFVGPRCEGDINECLSNPCSNAGTLDCVQLVNDYHCNCKAGFMGRHCESKVNFCATAPCQNGGMCTTIHAGHKCTCPEGFYGKNCEFSGYDCDSDPCQNGGVCRISDGGGYACDCPVGITGTNCEIDSLNECNSNPCKHPEAICQDKLGDYICYCPAKHVGKNCEVYDRNAPAGQGRAVTPKMDINNFYAKDLEKQRQQCNQNKCPSKRGNGRCDEECNSYACEFDGNDCSLGINPWANCTASIRCWEVFMDGVCNEDCNNPECLFDGRDCEKSLQPCNPIYDAYCQKHYANGYCDYGCNNAECNWDGLDCEKAPPELAEGVISMIILMDMQGFRKNLVAFLRDTSHQLRTNVRVKKDQNGHDMIYPWMGTGPSTFQDDYYTRKHRIAYSEQGQSGVIVYLEIDNRKCTTLSDSSESCFQTASAAAEFLAAKASKHTLSQSFPIYQVNGSSGVVEDIDTPTNAKYVVFGIIIVFAISVAIGVIVTTQRKRASGITWFPEGWTLSNTGPRRRSRRRGPEGQELRNMSKNASIPGIEIDNHGQHGHVPQWSDDDSDMPQPKRFRGLEAGYASDHTGITDYEEAEPRVWSQQHLEAADVKPISMLTPPQGDITDVNARGPCGMTPIMVASTRGGGMDTGEDDEDDSAGAVIQELVAQGAELNATMDKTGETSLHLAARYARADAAKRLLDAGADANAQDNTGRTPLHAAVAADALGVFQILLRNRATNLNARMHEGTTPLILAARLAIEGMVQDLISAEADINAADNSGKTALHWAAAVNNVEAVNILLAHGANRDAQDDKVNLGPNLRISRRT